MAESPECEMKDYWILPWLNLKRVIMENMSIKIFSKWPLLMAFIYAKTIHFMMAISELP